MLGVLVSGCAVLRDGIDMAYDSYVDRRAQCNSIPDPAQREACIQVAIQQMAAQVDNYQTRQAKPQPASQWRSSEPAMLQRVTMDPPPEYTPSLPPGVEPAREDDGTPENAGENPAESETGAEATEDSAPEESEAGY